MSTYEKFDVGDDPHAFHKKRWRKRLPLIKSSLSETLEQLSNNPMDEEAYRSRANLPDHEWGYVDWILRSLGDKKREIIQGQTYIGLSEEMRDDIKRYGVEKVTDTLTEEFEDPGVYGNRAAATWKKKYRR